MMASETDDETDRGCRRCGHDEAAVDKIFASSGGVQAMADVDGRPFRIIYCTRCGYTEHYTTNADKDTLADLFFTEL